MVYIHAQSAVSIWCPHSQQDNVPFHSVVFPATLLGTGDKWIKVKRATWLIPDLNLFLNDLVT